MNTLRTFLSGLLFGIVTSAGLPAAAQVTGTVTGQTSVWQGPSGAPVIQQQLHPNVGVLIGPETPYTILTPNAPALAPVPSLAPQTTILTPSAPSILVMPTPSLSGY
jgi:hypothetical protein